MIKNEVTKWRKECSNTVQQIDVKIVKSKKDAAKKHGIDIVKLVQFYKE